MQWGLSFLVEVHHVFQTNIKRNNFLLARICNPCVAKRNPSLPSADTSYKLAPAVRIRLSYIVVERNRWVIN